MPVKRLFAVSAVVLAASPCTAVGAERYVGTIGKLEASPPAIAIQLDGGGQKWVAVPPEAAVLRVAPGERNLSGAAKLKFDELRMGDRILVRAEGEPAIASQVLVLSLSDLTQKQQAERDNWRKRGISGRVLDVNPQTGDVTIATAADRASGRVVIKIDERTEQRRYRSDSARFSDARLSTAADIREGDHVQALGDRTPDGRTVIAEKVVSGAFRNFTATVSDVNAAKQEMLVRPAAGGPATTVKIAPGATLRRLGARAGAQLAGEKQGSKDASKPQNALDDSTPLTTAELRPGDAVVIGTLNGAGEGGGATVTAIAVIAGVEPLLKRSAEAQREVLGSWNLSLDPEGPGERGGGQ